MHKVGGLKTLSASFFVASALNHLAAFNMVGWNFLVPGQYTFGIACTIFLIVISLAALLWLAVSPPVNIVLAGGGMALALLAASALITSGSIDLKDYFIWGFLISVVVAVFAMALFVRLRHSLGSIRASRGFIRAMPIWTLTVAAYIIGVLLDVMPYLQSFHRQQIYLLGAAAITAAVLLQISKILSRKVS